MSLTNNDNNDFIIVDSNGIEVSVSQSAPVTSQSIFLVGGTDGSNARVIKVTSDGTMVVTGTFSAVSTNASIGGNNQNIPLSSSLIGGSDGTFLRPFKVSSDGTLFITGSISTTSGTQDVRVVGTTVTQSITGSVTVNNFPVTQSVKLVDVGTDVTQSITGSVTINNPVTSVSVNNLPTTQSVKIDQTIFLPVSVSNFPTVQTVTGTFHLDNSLLAVSVSNFPSIQTITGTTTVNQGEPGTVAWLITGSVTQNNFPVTQSVKLVDVGTNVTQSITGSVSVNNLTFVSGTNLSVFITASNMLPITGTVTVNQGAAGATPWLITGSITQNNFPVTQSVKLVDVGTNVTQSITGSVLSLPFGVQTVTGSLTVTTPAGSYGGKVEGIDADNSTITGNPVLIGGADGTTVREVALDSLGRIITAPAGSSTSVTSSLVVGYISTAATTRVPVRATTLTEQTTNAQRSIVSANANDTAAGTGARTVRIKYLDQNLNGPYTETVTLNGVTPVNTVNTNICYIESYEVLTAGSGGVNAGIISLKAATGGGGATICSIAAGDNRIFYTMHYVPTGYVCYITGISVSHNGTVVGSGGVFTIAAKNLSIANSAEIIVSDYIRQYGQASNTTRTWGTAIKELP
jgi:hypothetical protein